MRGRKPARQDHPVRLRTAADGKENAAQGRTTRDGTPVTEDQLETHFSEEQL